MSNPWYEVVSSDTPLMQGDIIFDCPLLTWSNEATDLAETWDYEQAKGLVEPIAADVIVMTQACDLEQGHVRNVVLCPHDALSAHKISWEAAMRSKKQEPTPKAWRGHCDDIRNGYLWNLAFLSSGKTEDIEIEIRVVDFHEIYTVPRMFLEGQLRLRQQPRLRLRPPYREHLSQAFARYFMRVGLPEPISRSWE